MGAFIGEMPAARDLSLSESATCPNCGRRMHHEAKLCQVCHNAKRKVIWSEINVPEMLDRHHLIEQALATGCYTIDELMERARANDLPTKGEILCKAWWVKTGRAE